MSEIMKVKVNGTEYNVVDQDQDADVDIDDINAAVAIVETDTVTITRNDVSFEGQWKDIKEKILKDMAGQGEYRSIEDAKKETAKGIRDGAEGKLSSLKERLETLKSRQKDLEGKISEAKEDTDILKKAKAEMKMEKAMVERNIKAAEERVSKILVENNKAAKMLGEEKHTNLKDGTKQYFKLKDGNSLGKAQMTSSTTQAQQNGTPKATGTGQNNGGTRTGGGGGGDPLRGFEMPFDSGAFARAMVMDGFRMDSMDAMFQSQGKSQKLMQVFYMLLRGAASGDLMEIAQLAGFVANIISMDEGLSVGRKSMGLFALQDRRRARNQEMEKFLQADPDDKMADREFSLAMNQSRSEDAIDGTTERMMAEGLNMSTGIIDAVTSMYKSSLERAINSLAYTSKFR